MRILLTISDLGVVGGAERVVTNLANLFTELGYEADILSFFGAERDIAYIPNPRVKILYKYRVSQEQFEQEKARQMRSFWGRVYYKNFSKLVLSHWAKKHCKGYDVIISSENLFFPYFRVYGTRYYRMEHREFAHFYAKCLHQSRTPHRISLFDMLIVLSARELALWQNLHKNVCIIPNFLPTLPTQTTDYTQKIVLSVGRMDSGDQKGFFRLIDIWEMVVKQTQADSQNGWQLHIVGDGVLRQELQKTIQSKGLQDSIILKPFTKNIEQEYLNASVYVMSSHNEGFGMVLIESASYGLPAIAFDIATGPSDIILDSHTGYLIADNDLQAYADKLQTLMRDEALRENLGRQAKERVAECFSKEAIARVWQTIIEQK